jgi:hypothetical protein
MPVRGEGRGAGGEGGGVKSDRKVRRGSWANQRQEKQWGSQRQEGRTEEGSRGQAGKQGVFNRPCLWIRSHDISSEGKPVLLCGHRGLHGHTGKKASKARKQGKVKKPVGLRQLSAGFGGRARAGPRWWW